MCTEKEKCDDFSITTPEGDSYVSCCLGSCKKEGGGGGGGPSWKVGLIILGAVVVGLAAFIIIMRKIQKPKSGSILKDKQKKFESRIKGPAVTGSLTKI